MLLKFFLVVFLCHLNVGFSFPEQMKPRIQVTEAIASTGDSQQGQQSPPELPTEEMPPLPSSSEITQSYEGSFIRVIASLVGLILLVVGTFWILKRLGKGRFGKLGSDKMIHILERRPLSPKSVLFLVQVGTKKVLISESQFEVRALASIEPIDEMEKPPGADDEEN